MTPDKNSQIAELNYIQSVRHHARLEALEEAAKIAEHQNTLEGVSIAKRIRELAKQ